MARYSVADWYGVVTPGGVALLPRTVPLSAVERVWEALRDGSGPGAAIEGLVGAFGAGLRNLPDFALLTRAGDDVRIALRGAVEAKLWLTGATGIESHSGSGVSTWTEQLIADVERAELSIAGQDGECTLLITDGVVLAGRLAFWVADAEGRGAVEAQPSNESARAAESEDLPWLLNSGEPAPLDDVAPAVPVEAVESHDVAAFVPWRPEAKDAPEPGEAASPALAAAVGPEPQPDTQREPEAPDAPPEVVVVPPPPDPVPDAVAPTADPTKVYPSLDVLGGAGLDAADAADPSAPDASDSPEPLPAPASASDAGPVARSAETMTAEDAPNDYDRLLFGETVLSSVEDAAVRLDDDGAGGESGAIAPPPPPFSSPVAPPPPPPPSAGLIAQVPAFSPGGDGPAAEAPWADHDGQTVLVQALAADPRTAAALGAAPPAPPAWRPPRLLVAGQSPVVLDRSAVVGVRPRFTRVQDGHVPHLVTVQSPKGEISRSHVELRLEGHTLLAVDLSSTNGTMLLRQGADPVRLHPGEPSILVPGDRIDLGDGVMLEFEGIE